MVCKPIAAKHFAKQLGWQDTFVRLLISGPLGESSDSPTTTKRNSSVTPSLSDSFSDSAFISDAGELPLITSTPRHPARPDVLDICQKEGNQLEVPASRTPTTPMFLNIQEFDDMNTSEEDRSQSESRSSSASIEDLSAIGLRAVSIASTPVTPGSVDYRHSASFSSTSELGSDIDSRRSSSVLQSVNVQETLDTFGLQSYAIDTLEQTEELCQNVLIALLTTLWKGLDGSDKTVWRVSICVIMERKKHYY